MDNKRILFAVNASSNLKAGEKDIIDIFQVMTSDKIGCCNKSESTPIYDCKDEIEFQQKLKLFLKNWNSSNQLVFYFTGHGTIDREIDGFCFEFGKDNDKSYLPFQNFINLLKISSVKKSIILIDSCYSGQITKNNEKGNTLIDKKDLPNGYVILSSSSNIELSYEFEDGSGSVFTTLLGEALRTGLRNTKTIDGFIYPDQLCEYINLELTKEQYSKYKQSPRLKITGAKGSIWISKNVSGTLKPIEDSKELESIILPIKPIQKSDFIDNITNIDEIDIEMINYFRSQLKPDILINFPASLTPIEFLNNSSLMENGFLTHAGLLLFGKVPSKRIPSAITQCVVYFGENKTAGRDSIIFENSITEQIEGSFNFLVSRMEKLEFPSENKTKAKIEYKYPLICLREIIANALVHRDYSDFNRNTHIRLFSNRIEVSSPGKWNGTTKGNLSELPINLLESQSIKRNHRLAKIVSWIKQAELEGSGIPKSVQDCVNSSAPVPTVTFENDFITVVIYPRGNWNVHNIEEGKEETEFWIKAKAKNDLITYSEYLEKYPKGKYMDDAKDLRDELLNKVKHETILDIKLNKQYYGSYEVLKLINNGKLTKSDLISNGILTSEETDNLLYRREYDDDYYYNLSTDIRPSLPPDKNTDIYFLGVPGAGKTSLMAGILYYARTNGMVNLSIENPSGVKYANYLFNSIKLGSMPPASRDEFINYVNFSFIDNNKNTHPINFIEMSGEFITDIYRDFSFSSTKALILKEYLKNDNRKLLVLTIDYDQLNSKEIIQEQIIEVLLSVFENNGILPGIDAIFIVLTKVDLLPRELILNEYVEGVMKLNFASLLNIIKNLSNIYGFSVEIFPYSLGDFKLKDVFKYNENLSKLIFDSIVNKSQFKKEKNNFWSWLNIKF